MRAGRIMAITFVGAALLATSCRCTRLRGNVDTTKDYYDDDEAPEYQVRILNGHEERVPWAKVPEASRYLIEYDPKTLKPKVRVPIVKWTCTSRDAQGRPVPMEEAYRFEYEEVGLNPKHHLHGSGGYYR